VPVQSDGRFEGTASVPPGTSQVTVTATDLGQTTRTNIYEMQGVTGATASYQYDPNGNLTQKSENGDVWDYVWNAENQFIRVCKDLSPPQACDSDSVAVASFKYDPIGRRIEKSVGSTTYSHTYQNEDTIVEHVDDGNTLVSHYFVHGPGVDEPLTREESGVKHYYHADALGSVTKLTDQDGDAVHDYHYDAWGNLEIGAERPGYAFTGREWDPALGFYYYRARYYDPAAGRFAGEDPVGFEAGDNFYTYVENNPALLVDPFGLDPFAPFKWVCRQSPGCRETERRYPPQETSCEQRCAQRRNRCYTAAGAGGGAGAQACRLLCTAATKAPFFCVVVCTGSGTAGGQAVALRCYQIYLDCKQQCDSKGGPVCRK